MVIPMMSRTPDILFMTEYIKNVLYFAIVRPGKILKNTPEMYYLCTDKELVYENYYSDFGPLNLGCVYKFCKILNDKIKESINKQTIVYYTSVDAKKKVNAAFLLGSYGVLYMNLCPKEALKPLMSHGQSYRAFQDATQGESNYTITLLNCLQAIKKARDLGFFNFNDFNYEEYIRLDKIQGGDLNWIVPGKFLAFIGPVDYSVSLYHPPEMYIEYFRENSVKIVIRLNKRMYDASVFTNAGITHYDLFFHDGTCPPRHILVRFLQISEEADGALAVHCKAGLGRTGSLIGSYLIKHYRMTAHEAIGWVRICRPGSVIGHQQAWLEQLEPWLIKQGNIFRKRNFQDTEIIPVHEYGIYSIAEKACKQRLVLTSKVSPVPQIQRQTRSNTIPPSSPQASRNREVPNKAPDKEQWEPRLRVSRIIAKVSNKGDLNHSSTGSVSRRGSGAGEPRPPPRSNSRSNIVPVINKDKLPNDLKMGGYHDPSLVFPKSNNLAFRTLKDSKAHLLKTNTYEQRTKHLNSSITITQRNLSNYRSNNYAENVVSGYTGTFRPTPHTPLYSGSKCQTQSNARRRLGRSPSPSPSSSPTRYSEQNRATNTPHQIDKYLIDDANFSKTTLREALSRLKLTSHRDGSIGTASLGAASLGARRDAPPDKHASSVRSDERPIATQGDMLNSIKFQRNLRETLNAEKISTAFQQKEISLMKPKPSPTSSRMGMPPRTGNSLGNRWATVRPRPEHNFQRPRRVKEISKYTVGKLLASSHLIVRDDDAEDGSELIKIHVNPILRQDNHKLTVTESVRPPKSARSRSLPGSAQRTKLERIWISMSLTMQPLLHPTNCTKGVKHSACYELYFAPVFTQTKKNFTDPLLVIPIWAKCRLLIIFLCFLGYRQIHK